MQRRRNRRYNKEDVKFIHENYAEMSNRELAEARGLSIYQVSNIVTKLRKEGVRLPRRRRTVVESYLEEIGITPRRYRKRRGRSKVEVSA